LIINDNMLGFQAEKDFVGDVVVKVTAFDERYHQTTTTWNITFTPVNDAPRSKVTDPPAKFAMPEDSVRNINLNQLVLEVDKGDALTTTFDQSEGISIDVDPDTLLANVSGDPNWFGESLVTMTFTDMEGATVSIPVLFVVENVADPPVLIEELGTIVMDEDWRSPGHLRELRSVHHVIVRSSQRRAHRDACPGLVGWPGVADHRH